MKGLTSLFLGLFGTFAFSWLGLVVIPNSQIGHLDPQMDEEGTDVYPVPQSGMVERGRQVYVSNGCMYCHSQQVRPEYAASDIDRKWGERRSAPRDYVFDRPVLLGKMRIGPDLSNIGKRAPAEDANAPAPGASPAGSPAPNQPAAPGASPAGSPASNQPAAAGGPPPAGGAAPPAPNKSASPAASAAPAAASPSPAAPAGSPAVAAKAGSNVGAQPAAPPSSGAPAAAPAQNAPPGPSQATAQDTAPATGEAALYSAAWHHRHLYSPRSVMMDSTMPAFKFLYDQRHTTGERSADALKLTGEDAPPDGYEVVPTYDAKCLVAYLMSRDQSHPLKEVKSANPPSPPAPGKGATTK